MKSKKDASQQLLQPTLSDVDLKALIHEHSLFFDHLVDLIPARFYVPVPDGQERPWFHGLSKAAKASAKKESRENLKKARRARFNPDKSASTIDILNKAIEEDKKSLDAVEEHENHGNSGSDGEAQVDDPRPVDNENRSLTYEELRQRLHRRIEELRGNRNTRSNNKAEEKEKRKKNKKPQNAEGDGPWNKRKKDESGGDNEEHRNKNQRNKRTKNDDISYGKINLGGMDERGMKKRKLSKQQELEKAKRLEEAKKDPSKGKMIAEKHSWKAAMSRAVGEKVHDDPRLLQKGLKKEKKQHQKHAEKWKERIKSQKMVKEERQKARNSNIRDRIHQKKMRRIEKREKKLLRPGFEGRKEGYINDLLPM
ncbi:hypothetical protein HPP92_027401 [Vanilla planifolia]|uniref:Surfeit locus protein 6 n=1 Tax=Vanilla planifolia TaxID=51239 RepID=A0A835P987_VANPL|nr:hypothetical protein HPP92_027401 [Vanilla planifolia]